jgi:hypothetical protein
MGRDVVVADVSIRMAFVSYTDKWRGFNVFVGKRSELNATLSPLVVLLRGYSSC